MDLATDIVTINITKLAEELSPKDSNGKVIQEQAVTVSRLSRLVTELADFGFIHVPQSEWDSDSKFRSLLPVAGRERLLINIYAKTSYG
ncbi:plasmid replication initiator RepA [Atlantibacter hermannii]|uniref:plasmid replication initiator RepA n=1 Tax=Atlantibacter hermannii TaxID=565 RepID=UPI002FE00DC3